ncbi:hypothetical protein D7X88_04990 [bacterium C-53]|nr:hypothetical protein [Lachnospiraceae bacterium]NBI02580.1 hypothetical protein [Lachnospiraceae bacterium]RKJ11222.1 hypothetical protein D7X88_04990 [bacterium C-53]
MIKKIVFVFSKFFENKDWYIFNCPFYLQKGYEVEIWSLVQVHYKGRAKEPIHMFRDYEVKYFDQVNDFKCEIKKNNRKQTVFFVYPSLGENHETGYLIRRLIRQKGFQYCDYFYPPLVMQSVNEKFPNKWKDIVYYYYKHIKEIKSLFFSILYPPMYVFVAAQENLWHLANKFDILDPKKLKYINTPDYDKYINEDTNEDLIVLEKEGLEKYNYIVFLDEAHTHHSDFLNAGQDFWVTEDIYKYEICGLFDFLESQTGMEVIIALHPKAEYSDAAIFGGRKMVDRRSRELIKYSNFVITDFSTAISYIMLYKKKFVMYTTNQLNDYKICMHAQRILAKYLGCKIANISKKLPDNFMDIYVKQLDESKRKAYINRLVCSRKKQRNITSAQIIDKCLKSYKYKSFKLNGNMYGRNG